MLFGRAQQLAFISQPISGLLKRALADWAAFVFTTMRTQAMPAGAEPCSPTSSRGKLIKIGAKAVSHGRYVMDGRDCRSRCSTTSRG